MMKRLILIGFALLLMMSCDLFFPSEDSIPPTVQITSPADGETVSGSVIIRAAAEDNVGIFKVVFKIDQTTRATVQAAPYEFLWNTGTFEPGTHTIQAVAYDRTGNTTNSAGIRVTISDDGGLSLSNGDFLFEDDFNAYPEGEVGLTAQQLKDGWLAGEFGASSMAIGPAPGGTGGDRAFHFMDSGVSGSYMLANATFTPGASGTFSFDILFEENSYAMFSMGANTTAEGLISAFAFAFEPSSTTGDFIINYSDDNTTYLSGVTISLDQWYNISGEFDCHSDSYRFSIDDTEIWAGALFDDQTLTSLNNCGFMMLDGAGQSADFWVDDLVITYDTTVDTGGEDDGGSGTSPGLPAAPSDISLTKNSNTSVTIGWVDQSDNEEGFDIYRYMASEGVSTMGILEYPGPTVTSGNTSYTDSGLTAGETYVYMVKSWNTTGSSGDFIYGAVTLLDPPENMTATDGGSGDTINLSWSASANADYYFIYRTEDPSDDWEFVGSVASDYTGTWNTTTEPAGSEITPGTHYYYRVTAVDWVSSTEFYETLPSDSDEGWADDNSVPADFTMKYRYTSTGVGVYPKAIIVDPDGTGVKEIETQVTRTFTYDPELIQQLYELCQEKDIFRDTWTEGTKITLGTTISYTITSGGESYSLPLYLGLTEEESEAVNAVIDFFKELVTLPAPTWISATDGTWPENIQLDWPSVTGAESYKIYSSDTSDGEYDFLGSVESDSGLVYDIGDDATHYYKVAAVDLVGWTSELSEYDSGSCVQPILLTSGWDTDSVGSTSTDWFYFIADGLNTIEWRDVDDYLGSYTAEVVLVLYDEDLSATYIPTDSFLSYGVSSYGAFTTSGEEYYIRVRPYSYLGLTLSGSYAIRLSD